MAILTASKIHKCYRTAGREPDALAKAEFGHNHLEAWEACQDFLITGKTAAQGALEKPQDLESFLTNDLIDDCNGFDKERVRTMAREWK